MFDSLNQVNFIKLLFALALIGACSRIFLGLNKTEYPKQHGNADIIVGILYLIALILCWR